MRFVLGLEYDGTRFCGWQSQRNERSVQQTLEEAISTVADHPTSVVCAGRTDAGVHALGQVVHFESDANRPERAWTIGVNSNLPEDVSVRWAVRVGEEFHARFSARARTYRYVIHNAKSRSALLARRAWWHHRRLEIDRMRAAANFLIGEHDFSSLRASECQARSPVRTVLSVDVGRSGDVVWIEVKANAFLHHMVRNIAGTLVRIGRQDAEPEWMGDVLESRDRKVAGMTAPACGLYLLRVDYGAGLKTPVPDTAAIPAG
jgi:tRNA pseudouridine38-40 synthase